MRLAYSILSIVGVLGVSGVAWGQSTPLGSVAGQSALQSRIGDAVQNTCSGLNTAGFNADNPVSAGDDLFRECRKLVQTATGSAQTLGISDAQLNEGLLSVAHEELPATGTTSLETTNTQIQNVSGRISGVRGGATGINLTGLNLLQGDSVLQAAAGFASEDAAAGPDDMLGRLGAFVTGTVEFGGRDETSEEAGFDFNTEGLTAGVDYRFSERGFAGVALGFARTDNDFDQNGGELDKNAYSVSMYGSLFAMDNLFVDGIATFTYNDYDLERNIFIPVGANPGPNAAADGATVRTAEGDTHATEYAVSVGVGYETVAKGLRLVPIGRIEYIRQDVEGFSEEGANGLNLTYDDDEFDSFTTSLGGEVAYPISMNFGILQPQVRFEWVHEFLNDSRTLNAQYSADPNNNVFFVRTDSPERNTFILGVGVSALFAGGNTVFADTEALLGHEDLEDYTFTVGARFEF